MDIAKVTISFMVGLIWAMSLSAAPTPGINVNSSSSNQGKAEVAYADFAVDNMKLMTDHLDFPQFHITGIFGIDAPILTHLVKELPYLAAATTSDMLAPPEVASFSPYLEQLYPFMREGVSEITLYTDPNRIAQYSTASADVDNAIGSALDFPDQLDPYQSQALAALSQQQLGHNRHSCNASGCGSKSCGNGCGTSCGSGSCNSCGTSSCGDNHSCGDNNESDACMLDGSGCGDNSCGAVDDSCGNGCGECCCCCEEEGYGGGGFGAGGGGGFGGSSGGFGGSGGSSGSSGSTGSNNGQTATNTTPTTDTTTLTSTDTTIIVPEPTTLVVLGGMSAIAAYIKSKRQRANDKK